MARLSIFNSSLEQLPLGSELVGHPQILLRNQLMRPLTVELGPRAPRNQNSQDVVTPTSSPPPVQSKEDHYWRGPSLSHGPLPLSLILSHMSLIPSGGPGAGGTVYVFCTPLYHFVP